MKIYCSGIGGIGLSAYAALQAQSGHEVLGSDRAESPLLDELRAQGIAVFLNQDGSHVPNDCDLFVYSEAIPMDAPEREKASACGIPMQSYFQALGDMTRGKNVIAVCGTHGKSSTTAMAARLLIEAGMDPSVIVGTKTNDLQGRNWRKGESEFFVLEACEYRRSFHFLSPSIVLMTNVDGDHFDAFASLEEYRDAFVTFLKRLPEEGSVIAHGADGDSWNVAEQSGRATIDADAFPLPKLSVPGMHMRQNARLVLALAKHLGIEEKLTAEALLGFQGTWRRMEVKGDVPGGITVIDDYAHHPVEIRATLAAMKEAYPQRRLVCVFQPHTHDRTLKLYDAFVHAFFDAGLVMIPGIYNARSDIETKMVDVSKFVADIAEQSKTKCVEVEGLEDAIPALQRLLQPGDVLIFMGAGDIAKLPAKMLAPTLP